MKLTSALILSSLLFVSLSGHAADEAAVTPSAPEANLSTTVITPQAKPKSILDSVVLGYKSSNETGRFGFKDQNVSKDAFTGRTYKGKHEAKLGYKHSSGWGAYAQMTQYRYDYKENPNNNNKWSSSDPSLTITHPDFYNDGTLKLFGSLRYYVPNTDRSKALGVRQFAYYFDVSYKMAQDQEIFNEFNPRAFGQDSYAATDTRVKLEDLTTYTKKLGTWGRYGVGQWTQYEQHAEAPNGLTVDVFPFFDYTFTSKIFMGPRVYMPVLVQNSVYDGSRAATWENAYFQLFLSASL
jgi:hypothetical protein